MKKFIISLFFLGGIFALLGCHRHSLVQNSKEALPSFESPSSPPKIALVLGGGGSKGFAHLGVIRELEEAGIRPDFIVGCSSGALIGALYADEPDISRLENLLLDLRRSDLLDFSLFSSRFGVVKGLSLENFLHKNLEVKFFDSLKIPLVVVAADLHTGELIELGGGPLIPALCGSAAVPGVFKPVSYLGRFLIDGGVVDPIPVSVAKKYGAQVIIAVDIGQKLSDTKMGNFFCIAKRALEISYSKLSKESVRGADVVLQMDFRGLGIFADQHNLEIYERGRSKTREFLPDIEKVLAEKLSD